MSVTQDHPDIAAGQPGILAGLLADATRVRQAAGAASADAGTLLQQADPRALYAEYRQMWNISMCCPGDHHGETTDLAAYERCEAIVLSRDLRDRDGGLQYRGACLGCGWVAHQIRDRADGGENAAVEDALDHTHPGWRTIPIVPPPPQSSTGTPDKRQLDAWIEKVSPLLPEGWLDAGGPIRTHRGSHGTRHVGGRAPGGGYDLAHISATGEQHIENVGGQFGLF